jgi:hypothetical protein
MKIIKPTDCPGEWDIMKAVCREYCMADDADECPLNEKEDNDA